MGDLPIRPIGTAPVFGLQAADPPVVVNVVVEETDGPVVSEVHIVGIHKKRNDEDQKDEDGHPEAAEPILEIEPRALAVENVGHEISGDQEEQAHAKAAIDDKKDGQ